MPHDALPAPEPSAAEPSSSDDVTDADVATEASAMVELYTAGRPITLHFAPELAVLAEEIRDLWAHVLVDSEHALDEGAGDDAGAAELELHFTTSHSTSPDSATISAATHRLRANDPSNTFIVSGRVTTALIREMAGTRILLHAGAVELPDLGTVLVVGPSGAGKSTSTTALGQNGTYLTDELTILDPTDFRVTGYPKPVSRIMDRGDAGGSRPTAGNRNKTDLKPSAQGLRPAESGTAPSHILLLDRQPADGAGADGAGSDGAGSDGAGPGGAGAQDATARGEGASAGAVTAERTSPVEALHTLSAQSSSTWLVDGGLSRLMQLLDHCGGALTVRYREATALVEQLPQLVDLPPHCPDWRHVPGRTSAAPGPGEYAVTTFSDAIALAESFVVLRRGTLVSTQGLGALVWDILELSGPLTRDALLEEIIEVLGVNDQAEELLDNALTSLLKEQLIAHGG